MLAVSSFHLIGSAVLQIRLRIQCQALKMDVIRRLRNAHWQGTLGQHEGWVQSHGERKESEGGRGQSGPQQAEGVASTLRPLCSPGGWAPVRLAAAGGSCRRGGGFLPGAWGTVTIPGTCRKQTLSGRGSWLRLGHGGPARLHFGEGSEDPPGH